MIVKLGFVLLVLVLPVCLVTAQELTWKEMANLPQPVAGSMTAAHEGMLLLMGGSYWKGDQKQWTNVVQEFDPHSNTWKSGPPLPEPLSDGACAVLGNDVYIFGGGSGTEITADGLVLSLGHWKKLTVPLPEPRLYPTAVLADGYFYVFGGMSKIRDYRTVSNSFWRWRPGLKHWEVLPSLPGPGRINQAMAEVHGSIYIFGGATTGPKDVENLRDAYRYDISTRNWIRLPDLPVANRSWSALGSADRMLLFAGYTNELKRDVYVYDPKRGDLKPLPALPHSVADIRFVRIGDAVIGSGGELDGHDRNGWTMMGILRGVGAKK